MNQQHRALQMTGTKEMFTQPRRGRARPRPSVTGVCTVELELLQVHHAPIGQSVGALLSSHRENILSVDLPQSTVRYAMAADQQRRFECILKQRGGAHSAQPANPTHGYGDGSWVA